MKSIYQDKDFAEVWDVRAGAMGEPYKRFVLDPVMFELLGDISGKRVVELGCGNGYLVRRFLRERVESATLVDISEHNLAFARQKADGAPNVHFLEADVEQRVDLPDEQFGIVFSNMLFNEVADIAQPMRESCRMLKKGGTFIFSVTHPSWDLVEYICKTDKMRYLGNYFARGFAKFVMRAKDGTNREFEVEHYHRPLSDYANQLIASGFTLKKIVEPELNEALLAEFPRFSEYRDHPVGLIFLGTK